VKPIREMAQIELAAFVQSHLAVSGIALVLSGGPAVSYYVGKLYVSNDIDLIAEWGLKRGVLNKSMEEIGFTIVGKYYKHPEAIDVIEILPGPPSVGKEPIGEPLEIELPTGLLRVINPTDCVKDRLAAFFHWGDTETLRQAILVSRETNVDIEGIRRWAESEGHIERFEDYRRGIGNWDPKTKTGSV
jgi:hypothetical protein